MLSWVELSWVELSWIVNEFTKERYKKYEKKWFPKDYCNPASAELYKLLKIKWFDVEKCFTYIEIWLWHTFLIEKNLWLIIDPTYWQFDSNYKYWFVWQKFPNQTMNNNMMEWKTFMELQIKRSKNYKLITK